MSCQRIVMSLSFFHFITNLKQFGSQILEAWSHFVFQNKLIITEIQKAKFRLKTRNHTHCILKISFLIRHSKYYLRNI